MIIQLYIARVESRSGGKFSGSGSGEKGPDPTRSGSVTLAQRLEDFLTKKTLRQFPTLLPCSLFPSFNLESLSLALDMFKRKWEGGQQDQQERQVCQFIQEVARALQKYIFIDTGFYIYIYKKNFENKVSPSYNCFQLIDALHVI